MRKPVTDRAVVLLGDRQVGELSFAKGGSSFDYTDDLSAREHEVLGQVFEERPRHRFANPVGLPHWFANLLPEQGSGLRRYYAAQFGDRHLDDARLLLMLGADLPGAVSVRALDVPEEGVLIPPNKPEVDAGGLHLSALAGAQPKMSLIRSGERFTLPGRGQTGELIAKLPDRAFDRLCENEYLMMRWAAACGLDVPEVELRPVSRVPQIFDSVLDEEAMVYLVQRFDRAGNRRVHIEDLAQVADLPPALRDRNATYEGIGALVLALAGDDSFDEYVRRLVAMVLMGNTDAHLKNWSLRYADGRTAKLSPAYDLVCSSVYRSLRHAPLTFPLGGERTSTRVDLDCFRRLADTTEVSADRVSGLVLETAARMVESWQIIRTERKLFPSLIDHIDQLLARHPLLTRSIG
ncbi:type II toxin-antitoxin system HipA family toxin [Amycolatopsis magusensis]|uniref:type II toxin-antitoxin system HipA family toxin n=1 Tax=Amycolatopsis magusensis TaxID=882444 RepID=UPI0037AD5EDA